VREGLKEEIKEPGSDRDRTGEMEQRALFPQNSTHRPHDALRTSVAHRAPATTTPTPSRGLPNVYSEGSVSLPAVLLHPRICVRSGSPLACGP
jgi:hypothetical protein